MKCINNIQTNDRLEYCGNSQKLDLNSLFFNAIVQFVEKLFVLDLVLQNKSFHL
jgi:hypothetical protein